MKAGKRNKGNASLVASVSHLFLAVGAAWTLLAGFLLVWNILEIRKSVRDMAVKEALVHLRKDRAIRLWVASHGGVYVPSTSGTPPNPYLIHVPERDIKTPGGKYLTLMNPAYMIRQIMEHYDLLYGVKGHITSLKHFREETAPDDWERSALLAFEGGKTEIREFTTLNGKPCLRLMRPLLTEKGCLKCHGYQGYKVGDIRGGVSVSLPLDGYLSIQKREILWHSGSFSLIWLAGIGVIGFVGKRLRQQVTERERAEDRLRISETNYSILVEDLPVGIYIISDGVIVFANRRTSGIYGYSREELVGMESINLVHPDDRAHVLDLRQKRLRGERVPAYEIRGIKKDGSVIWVKRQHTVIEYNGRKSIAAGIEDVTALKQAKASLEQYAEELRKRNQELDQFASIASHDLQEPLRKIRTFGDILLSRHRGIMEAEDLDYLKRMQSAARRMQELTEALLQYSRLGMKNEPFKPVDLRETVDDALQILEVRMEQTGAKIDVGMLPVVDADRLQMVQLFQNLVANALKFHKENEPPVIRIYTKDPACTGLADNRWEICIQDYGIGFDTAYTDRIFAPFERLHGRMEGHEGVGMGLAICRKIVERHGGTITAESEPGKGAVFIVRLPKRIPAPGSETGPEKEE